MEIAKLPDAAPAFRPAQPRCFVNRQRLDGILREERIDAIVATTDANLYYLSGHAPDSVLAHFYEPWACAIYPGHSSAPPVLVAPEYDMTYCLTHPSWMETRFYGVNWTAISTMLRKIHAGSGLATELRAPLRALYEASLPRRKSGFHEAVLDYVTEYLPQGAIRLATDDGRIGAALRARIGARLEIVDATGPLRRTRLVKTPPEIEILVQGMAVNEAAVAAAGATVESGASWMSMVAAYRDAVQKGGAKWLGERGMLFGAGPDGGFVLDHDYVERQRFRPGETVILDCICAYRMYHADSARTAVVGPPTAQQRHIHQVVSAAVAAGEEATRAGVHSRHVEQRALAVFVQSKLAPENATILYHPIGLNVFDFGTPEEAANGWTLETDTMVNFEVFYRDPDLGGMHLEDTVRVTATGIERYSTLPRDLIVAA